MPFTPALALVSCLLAGFAAGAHAADGSGRTEQVRKLLHLLAGIRTEHGEAFDDRGALVRPIELEEARLLLAEARDLAARLDALPAGALDPIEQDLHVDRPIDDFAERVIALERAVTERTGVADDVVPPSPPSAARGAALYADSCAGCHGARGAGDGPDAVQQGLHPANFGDVAFMRAETPRDFFNVITLGRRRAGMPEWGHALSVQQRWDLVAHLWALHADRASVAEGQGVWLTRCAGCHGIGGDGRGDLASRLLTPPPDLAAVGTLAERSDTDLWNAVSHGVPGTSMPAFAGLLDDEARWGAVAYVRTLGLGGPAGPDGGPSGGPADERAAEATGARSGGSAGSGSAREARATGAAAGDGVDLATLAQSAVAESKRLLDEALAARARGDSEASTVATEAYAAFEPIEKRLAAVDPSLVLHVEEGFVRIRTALRTPGASVDATLAAEAAALHGHLDAARTALEPTVGPWALFAQSATIILREGFEIVLVVGALLSYVRRSGQASLVRSIWAGTGVGVVASMLTAFLLSTVLRLSSGTAEVLEGAACLLAAAVLFWVSYWLVSKAQADRWQQYIQGKVRAAIAAGSTTALAAAAFLAVYREGFETVLFYQALAAGAPSGDVMVPAGFVVGCALLLALHLALSRLQVRIPIGAYFTVTGGLLYLLAFVFAGRGVFELQEAGVIGLTPLAWAPRAPVLGIFPTVESLAAQAILLVLLGWALVVTLRRGATARIAALHDQIAQLQARVERLARQVGDVDARPETGAADDGDVVPPAGRLAAGSRRG